MRGVSSDRLAIVLGLWLAVALIYWPSAAALDLIWRGGSSGNSYTHGYLVLAASLWLLVRARERLQAAPIRPVGWAWLHVLLLPPILLAALLATLGWRAARICLFPMGLL